MNEYLIAEFLNSIDSIISQPIQLKQRIKYTTFDVSTHYIIFGASSGGLYIFYRHPCSFIKLIPSTEGSVAHLSISPDEKNIAVATARGTVCLVSNNDAVSKDIQVYSEHLGSVVTAMKWNGDSNELYAGDNVGRISVVVVRNFISKTMFQTPCATLMQLDSRIVQLDWTSRFLLISTLSRCYLCDTESEHYRQIGKKPRDGEYGACFFGTPVSYTISSENRFELGGFRILSDAESFISYHGLEDTKIFCARPGARLWEVQLNGTVVRTHQFKHALARGPSHVAAFTDDPKCRLSTRPAASRSTNVHSFNFVQMYIISKKFLLTYQRNGLYIFDPQNASVVFWTNVYTDIVDVRILNKFIYLWTAKGQIYVLLFSTVEDLVIKCLLNKKYLLCADLCISHQKHIKKLLPLSKKLYLLSSLQEKLQEQEDAELLEKFEPVSNAIKELFNSKHNAQKLTSGIFVVDNGHFAGNSLLEPETAFAGGNSLLETENSFAGGNSLLKTENSFAGGNSETRPSEEKRPEISSDATSGPEEDEVADNKEENSRFKLMLEEYELNRVNIRYRTNLLEQILGNYSLVHQIVIVFIEFENYVENAVPATERRHVMMWSNEKCLECIETHKQLEYGPYGGTADTHLQQAYTNINAANERSCKCGFPCPSASLHRPKFYETGRNLVERAFMNDHEASLRLCCAVPYLWKHVIHLRRNEPIGALLPLILQYGDTSVLSAFRSKFTYDLWNDFLRKCAMLKAGTCLKCESKYSGVPNAGISWTALAREMMLSIGPESTVYLLLQHADNIPSAELHVDFYQSAIFTTLMDNFDRRFRNKAMDFVNNIHRTSSDGHFGELLEKTLRNPQAADAGGASSASNVCSHCTMPLLCPVLNEENPVELSCGHWFHRFCYRNQNRVCNRCSCE